MALTRTICRASEVDGFDAVLAVDLNNEVYAFNDSDSDNTVYSVSAAGKAVWKKYDDTVSVCSVAVNLAGQLVAVCSAGMQLVNTCSHDHGVSFSVH